MENHYFHDGWNLLGIFLILFHDGLDVTRTPGPVGPVGPVLKSEKSERPLVQKEWGVDYRDLKLIDHTMNSKGIFSHQWIIIMDDIMDLFPG